MRPIRRLIFVVPFVLWAQPARGGILSNVLVNPGFEEGTNMGTAGWVQWGNAWRMDAPCRGGTNAGKLFGNWSTTTNFSYFYQVFPASRGQVWSGTAWVYNPPGDEMRGENRAYLTVGFLDAGGTGVLYCASPKQLIATSPTNEWIPLSVSARAPWNTAYASLILNFMQVTNAGGSARFDDCAFGLATTTTVRFADRDWIVYDWSWDWVNRTNMIIFSTNRVSVDTNGWLHLSIREEDGHWWCAELESVGWMGYGEYAWAVEGPLDRLESNTILGLFSFDEPRGVTNYEIDIEISRSLVGGYQSNLLYTVQPWYIPGNGYQTPMTLTNPTTTHRFRWTPDQAHWLGYYGHTREPASSNLVFAERVYVSDNVPTPPARCEINFWLCEGLAPADTQYLECVIKDFRFTPFAGVLLADDFGDGSRSNVWQEFGYSGHEIEETNGCLRVRPGLTWETAGYMTVHELGWDEGGAEYTFSALLKTISVDTARSGDDIAAILSFCSAPSNGWAAVDALTLEGLYDSENDRLTLILFSKDQLPGTWGRTNFAGTVTNASGYFAAGGMDLGVTLKRDSYVLAIRDTNGAPVSMTVDSGSCTGLHGLTWHLHRGCWEVGAWNYDPARGSVFWDRTEVRVDPPSEAAFPVGLTLSNGAAALSWTSGFYRLYSVMRSTNLVQGFSPCVTNLRYAPPLNLFTDAVGAAGAVFYYIESSADVIE